MVLNNSSCLERVLRNKASVQITLVTSFKFYFIFILYKIVLVLPNMKMNPPQVYMCSPT